MSTISRRAFLKTVGVGALSVAAMSVLAGCDTTGTQPVVETGIATINGSTSQTYLVGDYSVSADFGHPLFSAWDETHVISTGYTDYTLNGYASNYDQALLNEIIEVMQDGGDYEDSDYTLSAADIASILSKARSNIVDDWSSDFIMFSMNITNYTLEDLKTDAMWTASAPADVEATTLEDYTKSIFAAAHGISASSIVTASTGSCAIWGTGADDAFADPGKKTTIKAATDKKVGVEAEFIAVAILPRDWTSVNIKIAVPGATKAVVYPVTRASVNWDEAVVYVHNNIDTLKN